MPRAIASAGAASATALAVDGERAALGAVRAEDHARRLGAAGAEQAGEADDLARAHLERDVAHASAAPRPLRVEQRDAPAASFARP